MLSRENPLDPKGQASLDVEGPRESRTDGGEVVDGEVWLSETLATEIVTASGSARSSRG